MEFANITSDRIAGISIIGGLGVFGLATNGFAMYILIRGGKLSQSFQQLCFSHCIANAIDLMFFLFYCTPMIILQKLLEAAKHHFDDIYGVDSRILAFLTISERLVWEDKNTDLTHRLAPAAHCIVDECYVVFTANNYLWSFAPNYCGFILGKVLDFGTGVAVFGLIIIFDVFTIFRIRKLITYTGKKTRRKDLKFFVQSCLQFSVFVIKLTCFYFISGFYTIDVVTNHWKVFFTTSFVWQFTHCIDGLILIPFHYSDLRARNKGDPITQAPSAMMSRSRMEQSRVAHHGNVRSSNSSQLGDKQ
ncbi:hypothetical protein RB195_012601 [Necator americanus]|uniref:7TM GPCR serpentine receptor class x (Srx) domain-containing protein n=1 Tax=Necator americanus TaxID=51031 RepID=A0ABR1DRN4_NECAM